MGLRTLREFRVFTVQDQAKDAVTQALEAAVRGDREAAAELLPLLYGESRKLAQASMAKTPPGNTLPPTALVHEAEVAYWAVGASSRK